MKKMLVVIEGRHFTESQLEAAGYIARLAGGRITVALLEGWPPVKHFLIPAVGDGMFFNDRSERERSRELHEETVEGTERVRTACSARGMDITLHTYTSSAMEAILLESRFADIMLVPHILYSAGFIRELLKKAQCPVMLLPGNMQVIKEVILTYNGTFSSMYAIRTLFQLFPVLAMRKIKLVCVQEKGVKKIPHDSLLHQYLEGLCNRVEYLVPEGDPAKTLLVLLQYRKHTLVTFGAYGRNNTLQFFNGSVAEDALDLNHVYAFVAHP